MGWRGRSNAGPWPGRGPFSYLPPWQRPGWLYGRGACWWLLAPQLQQDTPQIPPVAPFAPILAKDQEKQILEQQVKALEGQLDAIRKRLDELGQ
jgi:hypothetical protein